MPDWLVVSVVGSVILTLAMNLLPMLFPKAARRAQERMIEDIKSKQDWEDDAARRGPRVRVFFPWKAMLIGSLVLTIAVNLIAWIAQRG